jgi:hypothetical protein
MPKKNKQLERMIDLADAAYPDGYVRMYHEDRKRNNGDSMARFIALEIESLCEGVTVSDGLLMEELIRAFTTAITELEAVRNAFENASLNLSVTLGDKA